MRSLAIVRVTTDRTTVKPSKANVTIWYVAAAATKPPQTSAIEVGMPGPGGQLTFVSSGGEIDATRGQCYGDWRGAAAQRGGQYLGTEGTDLAGQAEMQLEMHISTEDS